MDHLLQECRLALRNLRRMPQFTVSVLIVLALGLGATAGALGTLRTVFFTELPFVDSQRIHALWWTDREGKGSQVTNSWPLYQELKTRLQGTGDVEGITSMNMNLAGEGDPEIVMAGKVTPGFFDVFFTRPLLGSLHWGAETTRGAVLGEKLWTSRFGRDPGVLGRTVRLNGVEHPILGVLPASAQIRGAELFIPLVPTASQLGGRYNRFMTTYLRLAPGVGEAQIKARLDALSQSLAEEHPGEPETITKLVSRSEISVRRASQRTLGAILGLATGLLVILTLVNLANAVLARALAATEETALRLALGASAWKAIRPRLMESLLLGLGGAVAGLGVAQATLSLLRPVVSRDLQAARPLALDGALLGWTTLAALAVALGMAAIPGLLISRIRLGRLLNAGGRGAGRSASPRLRVALVVAQVALALTLLASFGSLEGTFLRLAGTPLGLRTKGVAVFTCDTSAKDEAGERLAMAKATDLMARLRAVPGVSRVGSIALLPVDDFGWAYTTESHEHPMRQDEYVEMRTVSPGLFDTLGIRLLGGRDFGSADITSPVSTAIVSESMARTFWPGSDPIGQEFKSPNDQWVRVVGLVADVRNAGPANAGHQMTAYFASPTGFVTTTFVVQFDNPRLMNLQALRGAVREVAPEWPVKGLRRMDDVIAAKLEATATQTRLMGFAGGLALLLALAGLHGLLAYLVAQRTREFGIRAALGASAGQIFRLVLKRGLWTSLLGILAGLAGALAAGRLLAAVLAEARPSSANGLLGAAAVLLLGSVAASLLPAFRAASIQPAEALRQN
ncbi:hypothetical protein GETHLI_19860 [Geothrix limicola]|uniref:Permease n=1 Tax=Geothrix limicola TaxID=2927978 RepID=A0ABQ5QHG3_9BACT|nr:ABC transporter permease [Geothrix limicola]GLH73484.1 hypothetical protein GETHLI_19860 [Geothrix limicola]